MTSFYLFCSSVFTFILVFKHAQVRLVSRWGKLSFFKRLKHSATRFMGVGTVAVPAILRQLEELYKLVRNLLRFHVECTESFDTRCVYNVAARNELEHFGVCGCVHTRIMGL